MATLRKRIISATATLALSAGIAFNASAGAVFGVNPVPYAYGDVFAAQFFADFVSGQSTTRVVNIGGTDYSSTGFITFQGFSLFSSPIGAATTGLDLGAGIGYGLYATFTQTFSCPAVLGPGVTCNVDTISLNLWLDPRFADKFTPATLGADPTVTDVGGDDILLATVNTVIAGTAGIDLLGGAFENVNTNFILQSPDGPIYFFFPSPFYDLAFSEFNNTSAGIACSPSCSAADIVAITGESGGTQFFIQQAPEPASLALVGLGLLAAGAVRRRRA
jgi:PEP-CTERM motif